MFEDNDDSNRNELIEDDINKNLNINKDLEENQ